MKNKKMIDEINENKEVKGINIDSIENEISYLCKLLHTSRPEQYIYAYIKDIFPKTIRSKKFDWLLWDAEFDIFIPELDLAIEYDGFHWHKEKIGLSDSDKNKLAKEHNITLFRVREVGLEETDCKFYFYNYNKIYDNIDEAINAIIDFINIKYDKKIEKLNDFDLDSIKLKTLKNLRQQKREQSIIGKWEEIEKYWDYENNEGIRPEDIRTTYKYTLNAICPYCNKKVSFIPRLSFRCYGKYSFTPHICNELDEYCLSLLDEKCKNGKLELTMNDIDDKRLKDWLIRIVTARNLFTTIKDEKILNKLEKKIGFRINCKNLYEMKIADYNDLKRAIKSEKFKEE